MHKHFFGQNLFHVIYNYNPRSNGHLKIFYGPLMREWEIHPLCPREFKENIAFSQHNTFMSHSQSKMKEY